MGTWFPTSGAPPSSTPLCKRALSKSCFKSSKPQKASMQSKNLKRVGKELYCKPGYIALQCLPITLSYVRHTEIRANRTIYHTLRRIFSSFMRSPGWHCMSLHDILLKNSRTPFHTAPHIECIPFTFITLNQLCKTTSYPPTPAFSRGSVSEEKCRKGACCVARQSCSRGFRKTLTSGPGKAWGNLQLGAVWASVCVAPQSFSKRLTAGPGKAWGNPQLGAVWARLSEPAMARPSFSRGVRKRRSTLTAGPCKARWNLQALQSFSIQKATCSWVLFERGEATLTAGPGKATGNLQLGKVKACHPTQRFTHRDRRVTL